MAKRIVALLKQLPTTPGVYQFLDAKKRIIYVGKAANLKSRVWSYFARGADLSPAKQRMIAEVRDIHIIPTNSEIEALLLEANLIKKFQPYYNVTLRDDKSYLYVKIATEEEWPRVFATRTIDKAGTYFGPFTSANAVREVLRVLRKFLPYRCGQKPFNLQRTGLRSITETRSPKFRACFWYHLGRCPGTCVGAISKTEYRKIIRRITLFFEGRMDELRRAMKKELGPERAPLEARRPKVPVALPLAGRLLTGRVALMENVLAHTRVLSVGEQYAGDVRDLARVLHLPKPPERIEGYDISNIMGREATGSMVVFQDGEPAKSEYKKFKIKTVEGANDVAMLEEVLTRRFRHSQLQRSYLRGSEIRSPAIWPTPDLIIVDGGKAQLNAVIRAVQGSSRQGSNNKTVIPVISVAKGGHGGVLRQKEEIYFPGERMPLKLPNASPALHLILRVRDEAHRFAIGYHTKLRKKKFFS